MIDVILASTSPRRRSLLEEAGISFRIIAPDVEELEPGNLSPNDLCAANAKRKALAVAASEPDAIVIGADTIVVMEETVFGKPKDLAHASRMLHALAGRSHHVLTGVCLVRASTNQCHDWVEVTNVLFRPLPEINIPAYLARIQPLDKAGAYSAQEDQGDLIANVQGCLQNVIGLPTPTLLQALQHFFIPKPLP